MSQEVEVLSTHTPLYDKYVEEMRKEMKETSNNTGTHVPFGITGINAEPTKLVGTTTPDKMTFTGTKLVITDELGMETSDRPATIKFKDGTMIISGHKITLNGEAVIEL